LFGGEEKRDAGQTGLSKRKDMRTNKFGEMHEGGTGKFRGKRTSNPVIKLIGLYAHRQNSLRSDG